MVSMDFDDDYDDESPIELIEQLLADNSPDLLDELLEAVEHSDYEVRVFASLALAEHFHDVRALPGLHEALWRGGRALQAEVAQVVWEIGDADPSGLIDALYYARGAVRDSIVEALDLVGWFPDDVDTEVTYYIATRNWSKLLLIGDAAVPGLISVLDDADGNIRRGAAWALGQIGAAEAVPYLIRLLDDRSGDMFGTESRVCDIAAEALYNIGTDEALLALETWQP